MTHRFFVPPHQISKSSLTISGADVNQIKNVLRLQAGDKIEVLDGTGKVYSATIKNILKDEILCEISSSRSMGSEPSLVITLIQSVPRESKMDFIIQKCTELGVSKIIPVISERTIIKLGEEKKDKRLARWRKIAKEAAEQSGRGKIPEITEVVNLSEALKQAKNHDLSIIPYEMEEDSSIKNILIKNKEIRSIMLAIGPEGGFSKEEVENAKKSGFRSVSLGKRILRTETAGMAALSMINYEFEL